MKIKLEGDRELLIISHLEIGDDTFDCERGSWNVTRARRDCEAGKHKTYSFPVREVFENNKNVEVEEIKVAAFVSGGLDGFPPLIFVIEDGMAWLIDGHHRLHALHRIGEEECVGYVIEDDKPYRVYFNGERVSPWSKK